MEDGSNHESFSGRYNWTDNTGERAIRELADAYGPIPIFMAGMTAKDEPMTIVLSGHKRNNHLKQNLFL